MLRPGSGHRAPTREALQVPNKEYGGARKCRIRYLIIKRCGNVLFATRHFGSLLVDRVTIFLGIFRVNQNNDEIVGAVSRLYILSECLVGHPSREASLSPLVLQ